MGSGKAHMSISNHNNLVAKLRAAPELASEADVSAMLLNSQEHNSILGLSFRWPGSILHISG